MLQTHLQGQQLREATLCCLVPKHLRLLWYIGMWDLNGRSDIITILIILYLKSKLKRRYWSKLLTAIVIHMP